MEASISQANLADQPPSTGMTAPVTNDALSEARNAAHLGDLVRQPGTVEGGLGGDVGDEVLCPHRHDLGEDEPGADGIDPDALGAVLNGRRLAGTDDPVLGRLVDAGVGGPVQATDGGPVDDGAATRLEHGADAVLHTKHHPAEVDVHQPVVELHGQVGERAAVGDAGHVEHGVHTPELLYGRRHQRLDIGFIRDVAMHGEYSPTDLGRRVLFGTADVGGHDPGALTDEDLDRRLGHTRTGPGDHGHLFVQQPHHPPPVPLDEPGRRQPLVVVTR